jgi:RHS repeat-associated protein
MKQRQCILRLTLIIISVFCIIHPLAAQVSNPNYTIGTASGNYSFSYNTAPGQLIEIYPAFLPADNLPGFTYQWQQSTSPTSNFQDIVSATGFSYTPGALSQTTYFKRLTTYNGITAYSNAVKINIISATPEDINYIRENDILVSGITTSQAAEQLPIGQKLQSTSYLDGLGRSIEKISAGTATPATVSSGWGDMVQFSQYDGKGREPVKYLPYTTTNQLGEFKPAALSDQAAYYTSNYNEGYAYSTATFDYSPANRVMNIKEPGNAWNVSPPSTPPTPAPTGNSVNYDLNTLTDNVQIFLVDYVQGDAPVSYGAYAANTLFKNTFTDENKNEVIEYTNYLGQLILKKVQAGATPGDPYIGWTCTYYIYDDFGLLRYQLSPEAVNFLSANNWSFAGSNGQQVLNNLCFQYNYDDKGRAIWKKTSGAQPLQMLYDNRDRLVFMQDGNQAALSTPQWTANLYDELDRHIITALYEPGESASQLQTDINNAVTGPISITNAGTPIKTLVLDTRDPNVSTYAAQYSIEFVADAGGNFETVLNDGFVAEIDPTATTTSTTVTTSVYTNPISSASLNNPLITNIIKYQFYDDYSYAGAKGFDNNFTNASAYSTGGDVLPIANSARTLSMPTGSSVKILGTNIFLESTFFYDEKGNHIQTLADNMMQGQDITTNQYQWDGRVLSTYSSHSTANTGYNLFGILTKNIFDQIGRVVSLQEQYGSNPARIVATYDMGRLKTKHLDPGYTGSGKTEMESLAYSYNIHNQLTGINKDYALKTPGIYNKWGNFFGLYLGYDNSDHVFNATQLDGQATGQLWSTQGDDVQRKYDYTYDGANRLINAAYNEKQNPTDNWDNSKMDFSVTGRNGQIAYDLNGNLLYMLQKGVVPGQAPINIDDLEYKYTPLSNQLQYVNDNATATANGTLGDFVNGPNHTANVNNNQPDYVYDANGNLIIDLNKSISATGSQTVAGITYNFLDKPEMININGKGTVQISYDADGNKLQKIFTPQAGAAGVNPNQVITTYINQFVYQQVVPPASSSQDIPATLSFINFEEGRIRAVTPVDEESDYSTFVIRGTIGLPGVNQQGAFDYFIRDQLGNTRMILTDETDFNSNTCTMELNRSSIEDPIFGQVDATTGLPTANNEVEQTRTAKPPGWNNTDVQSYVSKLSPPISKLTNSVIGPNSLLKVMAGDEISASTLYFYQDPVTNSTNDNSMVTNVIASLFGALSGSTTVEAAFHEGTTAATVTNQLGEIPPFSTLTNPDANNTAGTNPKAYLTILFFDERFNFIPPADDGSGSVSLRVADGVSGESDLSLTLSQIRAPKNGYAYIYVSNESDEPVYFDNLQVSDDRRQIIEEDHYYAYGLKIAGISSIKLPDPNEGNIKNNYLYNNKELWDDGDLNWYDYGFRNYDVQIGRFVQIDPLTDEFADVSTYQYAANDPINNVDVNGLAGIGIIVSTSARMVVTTIPGEVGEIATVASVVSASVSTVTAVTTSLSFINIASLALTSANIFVNVVKTLNSLNGPLTTVGVGEGCCPGTCCPTFPEKDVLNIKSIIDTKGHKINHKKSFTFPRFKFPKIGTFTTGTGDKFEVEGDDPDSYDYIYDIHFDEENQNLLEILLPVEKPEVGGSEGLGALKSAADEYAKEDKTQNNLKGPPDDVYRNGASPKNRRKVGIKTSVDTNNAPDTDYYEPARPVKIDKIRINEKN